MDEKLNSQQILKDADELLGSEMIEIEGGNSSSCGGEATDFSAIEAPSGGCSSCNKTQSCQTHT
ncbi:MAG: hypothetical protein LKI39_07445 [Bacteroides sp.]|jgi:hypothetical protein|nr:hypothetical protein [Bacteroides sp.]MCI1682377.1 hypothetical protein [Bacteroides sp.]